MKQTRSVYENLADIVTRRIGTEGRQRVEDRKNLFTVGFDVATAYNDGLIKVKHADVIRLETKRAKEAANVLGLQTTPVEPSGTSEAAPKPDVQDTVTSSVQETAEPAEETVEPDAQEIVEPAGETHEQEKTVEPGVQKTVQAATHGRLVPFIQNCSQDESTVTEHCYGKTTAPHTSKDTATQDSSSAEAKFVVTLRPPSKDPRDGHKGYKLVNDEYYVLYNSTWHRSINNEQFQVLTALHRTLLHQHYDFFLASQYHSVSTVLKRLAARYTMAARMWRHGMYSYLEIMRSLLCESLEHIIDFLYLAYSMLALLDEMVGNFRRT